MKANDLRIGNLVRWEDESKDIEKITSIEISHNNNGAVETENTEGFIYLFEFQPIPITPEWLERAGFEKNGIRWCMKDIKFHISNVNGHCVYGNHAGDFIAKAQHIHQLQNLYFALTGNELEFKPLNK